MEDGRTTARRVRRWVREARLELERQDEELGAAVSRLGLERAAPGGSTRSSESAPAHGTHPSYAGALRG